jgi:hypothetical protein
MKYCINMTASTGLQKRPATGTTIAPICHTGMNIITSLGRKQLEKNYGNGVPDRSTAYTYDSKGRIAGTKSYDSSGKELLLADYSYFQGGLLSRCEQQLEGIRNHICWMRDTAGLLIEKTTYTGDYTKQTNEDNLNYDQYGNWLKQSVKGTITENYFIVRTIEYYK